jgi:hypothetical protein
MPQRPLIHARGLLGAAGLVAGVLALGCTGQVGGGEASGSMGSGAMPGAGATGGSGVGGATGGTSATGGASPMTGGTAGMTTGGVGGTTPTGGVGGTGVVPTNCVSPDPATPTVITTPKRVIRLTEYQLFNAYTALFGAQAAATITMSEAKPDILEREFPPISGELSVSEGMFALYDRMAQSAMAYVVANSGTLTSCGTMPSDMACVQAYVLSFAEKAFRHPLTAEETTAITGQFWTEMNAAPASVPQLLGYGVYGVLSSPSFIYRTEFGADIAADGALTPYETATSLAMFLTDAPPDADLLAAAAGNALGPQQLRDQATRLLATPQARANLEIALMRYFQLTGTQGVILNPEVTPGLTVTGGLLSSIYHEGELFMKNVLWGGPLANLLLSKQTWTSDMVASQVYKVGGPTAPDADGFGLVDLPAGRSGLLTLSTFLTSGTRSTGPSPVTRGLAVNGSIVCEINPPFPEVIDPVTGEVGPDPEVEEAITALADASELERTEYRLTTPKCAGCHAAFDTFGMVLTPFDGIGRAVTMDLQGRPIDATWTTMALPESVNGGVPTTVTNAVEVANALVASGAMDRCIAMNFINFALTEVSKGGANNTNLDLGGQTASCAVQGIIDSFATTDKSFTSLMREIAASDTLTVRSKGL